MSFLLYRRSEACFLLSCLRTAIQSVSACTEFWAGKAYQNICKQQHVRIRQNDNLQVRDLHATKVCSLVSIAFRKAVSSTVDHFARANWDKRPSSEHVLVTLIAINCKNYLVIKSPNRNHKHSEIPRWKEASFLRSESWGCKDRGMVEFRQRLDEGAASGVAPTVDQTDPTPDVLTWGRR